MASVVFEAGGDARSSVSSVLAAEGVELQAAATLDRTRLDTLDGRLFAAGIRAELRTTDARTQELVVTSRDGSTAHLPLQAGLDPTRPLPADRLPPGPVRTQLEPLLGGRTLAPQVRSTTRRRSGIALDDRGSPTMVVHVDEAVGVLARPWSPSTSLRVLPLLAVEVAQLPGGDAAGMRLQLALTDALRRDGYLAGPREGDVLELVAVRAGVDRAGWRGAVAPTLHRQDDALGGVRSVLRSLAEELDHTWEAAADHLDDEALHAHRIAIRRTRSLLAETRRILPKHVRRTHRDGFRRLGRLTSVARDLDVHLAGWGRLVEPLSGAEAHALEPVLAQLAGRRAVAHREVARALRSRAARDLQHDWQVWLGLPDASMRGGRDADRRLGAVMAERILAAHHRLLTDGRRIDADASAAQLHELRKDAKRLRYLLDAFGHLGGRTRARKVVSQLKDLQDGLGVHRDVEVQADRLRRTLSELADGCSGRDHPGLDADARAAGEHLLLLLDEHQAAARAVSAEVVAASRRRKARARVLELTERMGR